jgi:hypothetical protein
VHVGIKIGWFYAGFLALEWLASASLDHVTLAVAAVFCAGVVEDANWWAEEHRKREMVRRDPNLSIDLDTGKLVRKKRPTDDA